jgi:fructokinase
MFLVVGESLVDVVERPDGTRNEHAGGSPMNVAVGLGRAGLDVTLATALGDDAFGELIRWHLSESRVAVQASKADRTSSALARLDDHGSATYTFDVAWDPGRIDAGTPIGVHTGSIAAALPPGASEVEDLLVRLRPTSIVTLDPNVRPSMTPDRVEVTGSVERLVALADVVKASDEDLAWLYPDDTLDGVAERWLEAGVSVVVVTRGRAGSLAWARSGRIEANPPPAVDVVDTVGAGDAYMSGLIVALHREGLLDVSARPHLRDIEEATVRRLTGLASRSAAIVVARAGAEPPWRAELLG